MDKPRETFILKRGQYNDPTERVEPGMPRRLPPLESKFAASNPTSLAGAVDREQPKSAVRPGGGESLVGGDLRARNCRDRG